MHLRNRRLRIEGFVFYPVFECNITSIATELRAYRLSRIHLPIGKKGKRLSMKIGMSPYLPIRDHLGYAYCVVCAKIVFD